MASPWSHWDWDNSGFWVSSRLNPQGQYEYKYEYKLPRSETPYAGTTENADRSGTSQNVRSRTPISVAADISSPVPSSSDFIARTAAYAFQDPGYLYYPNTGYDYKRAAASLSPTQYKNYAGTNTSAPKPISQPLLVSSPSTGVLSPDYCVITQPSRFFKVGRVFKILWTEPARPAPVLRGDEPSHFSKTWLDGDAYTEIRRFVVIREGRGYSLCLAIHTYNGRGTLKAGVIAEEHAALYPATQPAIMPRDEKMNVQPFPIIIETDKADEISPMSRINLRKIYTVEHYNRVCNIGRIEPAHVDRLEQSSTLGSPAPAILKELSIAASDPTFKAAPKGRTIIPYLRREDSITESSSEDHSGSDISGRSSNAHTRGQPLGETVKYRVPDDERTYIMAKETRNSKGRLVNVIEHGETSSELAMSEKHYKRATERPVDKREGNNF